MGYNASINAGILNHFGTAVLRVGHTLIRSSFGLITNSRVRSSSKLIYRGRTAVDFFNPAPLLLGLKVNLIGEILYGLVNELAQLSDKYVSKQFKQQVELHMPFDRFLCIDDVEYILYCRACVLQSVPKYVKMLIEYKSQTRLRLLCQFFVPVILCYNL